MATNYNNIIDELRYSLDIQILENISMDEFKAQLSDYINHLISTDFNRLISILYRLDVNESKLKNMLADYPAADAGMILANLMIERQFQKMKSKAHFKQRGENSIDDNEKW